MTCDHENNVCLLPFADDLTLEEFIERLIHIGFFARADGE